MTSTDLITQLEQEGHPEKALTLLKKNYYLYEPVSSDYWHQIGRLFQKLCKHGPARRSYQLSLQLDPLRPRTISNLVLLELADLNADAAEAWLDKGLRLPEVNNEDSDLLNAAGCDLRLFKLDHLGALHLCQEQLKRQHSVTALANKALCLHKLNRIPEAIESQTAALRLHINNHNPQANGTPVLSTLAGEACGDLNQTLQLQTQLLNLGVYRLQAQSFDHEGLKLLLAGQSNTSTYWLDPLKKHTEWDGNSVDHLMIWDDQGFGDSIQNLGWLQEAAQRCKQISLKVREPLIPLLQERLSLPKNVTLTRLSLHQKPWQQVKDAQCGLFFLPLVLQSWKPDHPRRGASFLERVPSKSKSKKRRIGLVWNAGRHQAPQPERCARIRDVPFELIMRMMQRVEACKINDFEIDWISLQLNGHDDPNVAKAIDQGQLLTALSRPDWLATAQVMDRIDVVISVDTSIAHLSGAMGVPTIVLLNSPADWRWGASEQSTFIYSSVSLCRCKRPGDWRSAVDLAEGQLLRNLEVLSKQASMHP